MTLLSILYVWVFNDLERYTDFENPLHIRTKVKNVKLIKDTENSHRKSQEKFVKKSSSNFGKSNTIQ